MNFNILIGNSNKLVWMGVLWGQQMFLLIFLLLLQSEMHRLLLFSISPSL